MKSHFYLLLVVLLIIGCSDSSEKLSGKGEAINNHVVNEEFQTPRDEADNVDSPTFWHNDSLAWIISTAKSTDVLIINDALTGKEIKRIGKEGNGLGEFNRPNGIFVIDSLLLVVERDNQRVQVLTLPNFLSLGSIADSLIKPYGLYVYKDSSKSYNLFVTDNYEKADGTVPVDEELDKRIHHYQFTINNFNLEWKIIKKFGAIEGKGRLKVVESICGDPLTQILLISEEDTTESSIKLYDFDGNFTGRIIGNGLFDGQVEGIALYEKEDEGYFIIADQSYDSNKFLVFDRKSLKKITHFIGSKTTNTDGIWATNQAYGKFTKGAFFAVHNDGNVSVFDWIKIEELLNTP